MTQPSVSVGGQGGLTRDLVSHVLSTAGFAQTEPARAEVAVLVDPRVDQLEGVRERPVVVVTSTDPEPDQVVDLVLQGADAVVHTKATASELENAVAAVAAGGCVLPSQHARAVVDSLRAEPRTTPQLTGREIDILQCIAKGASVKQTARDLGITPKTVENLQSRLFRKLGVRNRAQAIAAAHGRNLLPPPAS